ncbi:hypothetical protein DPM19_13155 [Actinomadura craniellae]|uniref:CdiI immunity protein domain-containing protein n=1 Tax=Actinomadura craniellae TaxID=2231787 RepID=A0A365H6F1_9ACTN|nr:hypothetical protein DPM19_13155 [Actinomadura craniellae]
MVAQLVKLIVDLTWFLDSCDDEEVDPDWAVKWLEHIAHVLADLPPEQRTAVVTEVSSLATTNRSEAPAKWVASFAEATGLTDPEN